MPTLSELSEMLAYAAVVIVTGLGWFLTYLHSKTNQLQESYVKITTDLIKVEKELVNELRIKELITDKLAPTFIQFEYISKAINDLRAAQASIEAKLDQLLIKKAEDKT